MGLDIYFRKITHPRKRRGDETLPEYLCDIRDKQEQEIANEAKQFLNDWLKKYKLIKGDHAKFEIANLYRQLHKYFDYEHEIDDIKNAQTIEDVQKFCNEYNWEYYCMPLDGYFRKVNCIYAYFADRLDDEKCIVTKDDLEDIMTRAIKVLKAHDEEVSEQLLPTCSGFFFGSTDYDEYYYEKVAYILEVFGKLLNNWTDDEDLVYVAMSW